jgi:Bacterial Ig domain
MLARCIRVFLVASVITISSGAAVLVSPGASGGATRTTQATQAVATGPQCTFNGSSLPLVTGVTAGSKIAVKCSGLPPLHPYLLVGTSLVLAIDPAAAPLLSGQLTSLSALTALLAALKEIDLSSASLPTSDISGNLNVSWTVPTFQALDPNASCPPTQQEFNSGLLGCALAMIDLTSFKPVGAGSALFEYSGFPLFPPNPTVTLSTSTATPNQTVSVSDAMGATTYWWASTLGVLQSALGTGSGSPPTVAINVVDEEGKSVSASSNAQVTPATYKAGVFTPPTISGGFAVPSTVTGPVTVNVQLSVQLDGLPLTNVASAPLFVNNPPTTSVFIPANGASMAGNQYLFANAFDYGSLTKVEFRLTGGALNNAVVATGIPFFGGWLAVWNTTSVPNGTYTLKSVAYDAGGLTTTSTGITVIVTNPPPTTSVLVPSSGATLSGSPWLDASASDSGTVTKVEFRLTGGALSNALVATGTSTVWGWLANWNTTSVPNGTYTLQSVAYDASGNSGQSTGVPITIAN